VLSDGTYCDPSPPSLWIFQTRLFRFLLRLEWL
jgi:hypothetical protein